MDQKPLTVAICIGTFNQAQYLRDCIQSVVTQTYPVHEIWVSDDASTDDTERIIADLAVGLPNLRYYRQPSNLGLSGNLSWVLAQPQTDLVVRLDSDDRLEREYVNVLASLMAKYPLAGFAHSDVFEMNGDGERERVRRLSRTSEFESAEEALLRSATGFRVAANCLMFRSSALAQARYYRPTPGWSAGEDWSLCIRLAANGWGNVYSPRPLTNYRTWADVQNTRAARVIQEVSNLKSIYEDSLIPEFLKRGWNISILRKYMRKRAVTFAMWLDSPVFSDTDRESYKARMRELGDSLQLSFAIAFAEAGLNPVRRALWNAEVQLRDRAKACLSKFKPHSRVNRTATKVSVSDLPAHTDEGST
jgi:glycosyltransferase involved in cell wall biosynthesis